MNARTVIELKAMLDCLPDDMPVEFTPITSAFLGTMGPLEARSISFFGPTRMSPLVVPSADGAKAVIYLHEGPEREVYDEPEHDEHDVERGFTDDDDEVELWKTVDTLIYFGSKYTASGGWEIEGMWQNEAEAVAWKEQGVRRRVEARTVQTIPSS